MYAVDESFDLKRYMRAFFVYQPSGDDKSQPHLDSDLLYIIVLSISHIGPA